MSLKQFLLLLFIADLILIVVPMLLSIPSAPTYAPPPFDTAPAGLRNGYIDPGVSKWDIMRRVYSNKPIPLSWLADYPEITCLACLLVLYILLRITRSQKKHGH